MDLESVLAKLASGGSLSEEEFDLLRGVQERIDDAVEVARGRDVMTGFAPFGFRSNGAGFAIVVGHTKKEDGAYAVPPIDQYEYGWNSDLAARIKAACDANGVEAMIFYRDNIGISGAYKQVAEWGAACVVELHFNSFNGTANGTETLYDEDTNAGSKAWAQRLQSAMIGALGLRDRGLKERDPGDRGYGSLSAVNIPSALIEPFFGDNAGDAGVAHASKDKLAEAIAAAAKDQLAIS